MRAPSLFVAAAVIVTATVGRAGGFDIDPSSTAAGGIAAGSVFAVADTMGQATTSVLSGGTFEIRAGFWAALSSPAPATPTETGTATPSPTPEPSIATATPIDPTPTEALPTATASSLPTTPVPPTATTTPTPTLATPSPTASTTPNGPPATCVGDCDGDETVTVDEIVLMVSVALGLGETSSCPAADADGDGDVNVDEILRAVGNALDGCAVLAAGDAGRRPR